MSYKDITKILDLQSDDLSSSEVLLLIAMARRANPNNDNLTYSSLSRLVSETRLNRKTILSSRKKLLVKNFIKDTGLKTGRTTQIPVFQLTSKFINIIDNSGNQIIPKRNQPKNGTLAKPKDPNFGTSKDPKNGTAKDPNFGTLNNNRNNNNEYVVVNNPLIDGYTVNSDDRSTVGNEHIKTLKSLLAGGESSTTPETEQQFFEKKYQEEFCSTPIPEANLEPPQDVAELFQEIEEYFTTHPKGN